MSRRSFLDQVRYLGHILTVLVGGLLFPKQRGAEWSRLTADRYPFVALGIGAMMLVIVIRIFSFIVSSEGRMYAAKSETIHSPRFGVVPPLRGSIYARDNRPMAVSMPVYRLFFDFKAEPLRRLREPFESTGNPHKDSIERAEIVALRRELHTSLEEMATVLSKRYNLSDRKLTRASLLARWRRGFERGDRHCAVYPADISYMDYEEMKRLSPLAHKRDKQGRFAGRSLLTKIITREQETRRNYPFGSLARRTIGSIYDRTDSGLSKGKSGLEYRFDSLLRGDVGRSRTQYATGRNETFILTPPVDGASVYTTLDMNIQSIVEASLREQLTALGAESGTVVMMEVKTGKVVAISNLENSKWGYIESQNFAVSSLTEPGSTFKVASMMVALDDGVIHPNDTIDVGNGLWKYGGRVVRDHNAHRGGYGRLSAAQTIIKSSNVGVAKIITRAYESKPDEYVQKIRDLGFGTDLHLDIPGSVKPSIRKRSDNPNKWYRTTLGWMSYGYETQIPPIYTLAFFNAIANGGRYMRPYFVTRIMRGEDTLQTFAPQVVKEQICKPQTLQEIQEMLRRVVTEGTGKKALSPYVSISGKSGTAQESSGKRGYVDESGHIRHIVSFCAYFPSEAPRYSCIAVIRRPSTQFSAGGGVMAAPIIREIAESMLALELPIPLDSVRRSASPEAYTRTIAGGRSSTLQALLTELGIPLPRLPKTTGVYISLDSALRVHSYQQRAGHIPAVVGMSAMDAVYLLRKMGYVPRLEGAGNVIGQSIPAWTAAPAGTPITLELGYPHR